MRPIAATPRNGVKPNRHSLESGIPQLIFLPSHLDIETFSLFIPYGMGILRQMPNVIAIVGRPNVGKSALFNRIAGRRIAIVHDEPGVTRDRITIEAEWRGRSVTMVDTGGIGLLQGEKAPDILSQAALNQVEVAIESADVILLTVNVMDGLVALDREVASRLRSGNKPIILVINKVDQQQRATLIPEFTELGFDDMFPVSAIQGRGITDMMDKAVELLPPLPEITSVDASDTDAPARSEPVRLAIVGRPNVGKSSLINALTRSERVIVSEIPGTTRDSVDVPFEVDTEGHRQSYVLVDTAGIRKKRQIRDSVEFYSVRRSEQAVSRCELAILVVDAELGITTQDKKIAGHILEEKKACIIVVNKWDLYQKAIKEAQKEETIRIRSKKQKKGIAFSKKEMLLSDFAKWVQKSLFFIDSAPVIFTSALADKKFNLDRLLESIRYVRDQMKQSIPTPILNGVLRDAFDRHPATTVKGNPIKFYYTTQINRVPPEFLLFLNRNEPLSDQYLKYLEGRIRTAFGFEGCPLVIRSKSRPRSVEPIRKFAKQSRKPSK